MKNSASAQIQMIVFILLANFPALGFFGAVPATVLRRQDGPLTQADLANQASVTCPEHRTWQACASLPEEGVQIRVQSQPRLQPASITQTACNLFSVHR